MVEQRVPLETGAVLTLYTDGLVERRDSDIDHGIDSLATLLTTCDEVAPDTPAGMVAQLLPQGPDDDVAVLMVQIDRLQEPSASVTLPVAQHLAAVRQVRDVAARSLRRWSLGAQQRHDVLLVLSELVTNALVHGRAPVEVRLRCTKRYLTLEVHDGATSLPRLRRPDADDEHGRGVQLVSILSDRWAIRPTPTGKAVWAMFALA